MTALSVIEHNAVTAASPCEVLTFRLGTEEYGIDIQAVQEIRRYEPPTQIANSSKLLLGIIDLRGVIVPIVDLRRRLMLPDENGINTVTVIVHVQGRTVGLVVDAVSEVMVLDVATIQPRPSMGSHAYADFIVGFARPDAASGQLLQLVDLASLLGDL